MNAALVNIAFSPFTKPYTARSHMRRVFPLYGMRDFKICRELASKKLSFHAVSQNHLNKIEKLSTIKISPCVTIDTRNI